MKFTNSCFRPLSGSCISQLTTRMTSAIVRSLQFPSPIGELHFSIGDAATKVKTFTVSVPYRGATFLNNLRILLGRLNSVSVPYRGATFLNQVVLLAVILICSISVPYRGATFLNFFPKFYKTLSAKFPSPIGELHFSIMMSQTHGEAGSLFPSPIGELHFSMSIC